MTELVRTSGVFSLEGEDFAVDNNVFLVGDDEEVLVIDAAHDAGAILAALGERRLHSVVATHAHNDHINAAAALARATGAPLLCHPADLALWNEVYPDRSPDGELADAMTLSVGGHRLSVLHTPGHTPGSCCLYDEKAAVCYSGDTLFHGGPGATGRKWSDFETIIDSISRRLLTLAPETLLLPGHGEESTIGAEAPHLAEWIERGY